METNKRAQYSFLLVMITQTQRQLALHSVHFYRLTLRYRAPVLMFNSNGFSFVLDSKSLRA